ncbi:methyl-accepting chemotaxis protein [Metapseudomonas otitidis]|uniref:methyl-accepting chemotaxis protein n=1 Tax=Metapseudomonas otitidis TaxID=319939 RepID=UPI003217C98A
MKGLSIKQKILALSMLPLLLLALAGAWTGFDQARDLRDLGRDTLRQSLLDARRDQLANYMELALSAVEPAIARGEPERAKDLMRALRFDGDSGYFFVYDTHGVQVVSGDNPSREGNDYWSSSTPDGRALVQEYIEAAKRGGDYLEYGWTKPGQDAPSPKLAHVVPVPGTDWVLGTGFYIDDLDALVAALDEEFAGALRESLMRGGFSVVLLLGLVVGLVMLLVRSIHAPLGQAVSTMEDIARGEGDLTRRLDESSGHELGALATSFNRFAEQVRHLVRQTRESSDTLGRASEELEAFMAGIGQGIDTQHRESDQLATATEEMSGAAQQIAGSASSAAQAARDAEHRVDEARSLVGGATAEIRGLEGQVAEGVATIRQLGSESENIGGVLDVIRGVAEQINLLALNAAIEAARAGEQGRGFAVVADEVRTLAGRTQSSTAEIQGMIERLQGGAREAIAVIEQIRQGCARSVAEVARVGQALEAISEAAGIINGMNAQIADAAAEQTRVCESINHNVHQIVTIAQHTAESSHTANGITQRLAEMAGGLQRLVGRYRAD